MLLDILGDADVFIAIGTTIYVIVTIIRAILKGKRITDNLDLKNSSILMDKKECLNKFTNILRNQIKMKSN
jgi:hypothetical protein